MLSYFFAMCIFLYANSTTTDIGCSDKDIPRPEHQQPCQHVATSTADRTSFSSNNNLLCPSPTPQPSPLGPIY
eukprot:2877098-Ditylum_brightwellii.AAC.1